MFPCPRPFHTQFSLLRRDGKDCLAAFSYGDPSLLARHPSQPSSQHRSPGLLGSGGQRGVAAVEFALVLPLLLAVMLAVIELGLMLYNQAVITQASREGARYGIVLTDPKRGEQAIRDEVLRHTKSALINLRGTTAAQVTVVQSSPAAFPNPLQVTVSYDFNGLALAPLLGALGKTVRLTATTTMVHE